MTKPSSISSVFTKDIEVANQTTARSYIDRNIFRAYYLRRIAEGLPEMKALMATSHKLIRVIFSMLTHRMPFKKEVAAVYLTHNRQ